jgi:hypothetical protein
MRVRIAMRKAPFGITISLTGAAGERGPPAR